MNTTALPYLSYSDNFTKNISSYFNGTLNASLSFNVLSCGNISLLNYTSSKQTYKELISLFTCQNSRVKADINGIENATEPSANIIYLIYGGFNTWAIAVITAIIFVTIYLYRITTFTFNKYEGKKKDE